MSVSGRSSPVVFRRWLSRADRSQAFSRFKLHHTEINHHLWCIRPVTSMASHMARHAPPDMRPELLFHASGPDVRRLEPDLETWRQHLSGFENWMRLSLLVSALSYLEVYVAEVLSTSLRSDPLLQFGDSRQVDGVRYLKRGRTQEVADLVKPIVKGTWPQRLAAFEGLFGYGFQVPSLHVAAFEKMRTLRNSTAHRFGRRDIRSVGPYRSEDTSERLQHDRLVHYLGLIDQAAERLDLAVLERHIGEYELLDAYHRWLASDRRSGSTMEERARLFSKQLGRIGGTPRGREYMVAAIEYYEGL